MQAELSDRGQPPGRVCRSEVAGHWLRLAFRVCWDLVPGPRRALPATAGVVRPPVPALARGAEWSLVAGPEVSLLGVSLVAGFGWAARTSSERGQ